MLFKSKKEYIYFKGKYYLVGSERTFHSLTNKEKNGSIIYNFPEAKIHLNKYDSNQPFKHKWKIDGEEKGISYNEINIPYILDWIYLSNSEKYPNILLKTKYFSMCLLSGVNYLMIEHSETEGSTPNFFAPTFNFEEFLIVEYDDVKDKLNDNLVKDVISVIIFLGAMYGLYYTMIKEEDVIIEEAVVEKVISYTDFQKDIIMRLKQRKFINMIEQEYSSNGLYEKMFSRITHIRFSPMNNVYEYRKEAMFAMRNAGFNIKRDKIFKVQKIEFFKKSRDKWKLYNDINKDGKSFYNYLEIGVSEKDTYLEYSKSKPYNNYLLNNKLQTSAEAWQSKYMIHREENIITNVNNVFKKFNIIAEEVDATFSYFKYSGIWDSEKASLFLKVLKVNNILVNNFEMEQTKGNQNNFFVKFDLKIRNIYSNRYNK
jgi:hypothetical protein